MGALIWLASYPKSGNTWVRSFLHNLLRGGDQPVDINRLTDFCYGESDSNVYAYLAGKPAMELMDIEIAQLRPRVHFEFTKALPDSIFVKTHNYLGEWHGVPLHNMEVTAGGIYVVRNPLDVIISMTHHYGKTLDQAIDQLGNEFMETILQPNHVPEVHRSWSLNVKSWTEHENPQLLVVRYEDLLNKPRTHFKRIAHFLGLNPPPTRLERAIKFSSFKALKNQERERGFRERSFKAESFFREGRADQWRDVLTPEQVRRVIADHREQMERFGYIPKDYA